MNGTRRISLSRRACSALFTLSALFAFGCADLSSFEQDELSSEDKILGGENGRAPQWMVSLRAGNAHICGGSLIKKNWVLTAAHCVDAFPKQQLSVCVGRTRRDRCRRQDIARVEQIRIHSGWNGDAANGNDIALLRLSRDFNRRLAALATERQEPRAGALVTARGWGVHRYRRGEGQLPKTMQQIEIPFVTPSDCRAIWGDIGLSIPRSASQKLVCTEMLGRPGRVSRGGVCHGDSGGPLTANGRQIGLVSFGPSIDGQCVAGAPAVFTRISKFRRWISNNTR